MSIAYVNGGFVARDEARVSAMDRGFLFADGAYELLPVYSRKPFRVAEHLRRLASTLAGLRIANPHDEAGWAALIGEIVARNQPDDQAVYLQVTRGADLSRRNHLLPQGIAPTVFVMSEPLTTPPAAQREQGVAAISSPDIRWLRCDLKTTALLANCLLRQQAVDAGCVENILFRDGFLTEGSASNVFLVKDGVLLTPPRSHLMLAGVTYDVVLELAQRHGLPHQLRQVAEAQVRGADELWLTSSTKEVLPVTRLDGRPIGGGRPGPVFRRMYGWYQEFKARVMRGGE